MGVTRPTRTSRMVGLVLTASATFLLAACGHAVAPVAQSGPQPLIAPAPGPVVVNTRTVAGLGEVLVNEQGYTLYVFPPDNRQTVTCVDACARSWPPLMLPSAHMPPEAGAGVNPAQLGSTTDPAGGQVATYAGWPLYTYAGDVAPGQGNGQGLNLNGTRGS